ncbi:MAG: DEAD/DEAH box helicase [Ilumatobacteraceae bacterium]
MISFADLGVAASLVESLKERGIVAPTEIQALVVRDGMAGKDIIGRAPTGSGKTIAFGLVMVAALRGAPRASRGPAGLILVPTRELADQVGDELALLLGDRRSVAVVVGGVAYDRQVRSAAKAAVVVATPGRLEDLLARRDIALGAVRVAVVDEADRMADMGFLQAVQRILALCPGNRQTLLFSATLDDRVATLSRQFQRSPQKYEVSGAVDAPNIEHVVRIVPRERRLGAVADELDRCGSLILFCRTKHGSDRVSKQLGAEGISSVVIHGNRSQAQRRTALESFKAGRADVLVATDVAARGIHIDAVPCVIHWDPPAEDADYVHRSGRTARAGQPGRVVSLVDPGQRRLVNKMFARLGYDVVIDESNARGVRPGEIGWLAARSTRRQRLADAPEPVANRPRSQRGSRPRSRA